MSRPVETFQLADSVAELYESRFVPRLFTPWARRLVDVARVAPGQSVLDVACGTGAVTREVASRMGGLGRVVGVDINEGMLAVARRLHPDLEWQKGDAAALPFSASSFDTVLCQAALMFFPDPAKALREMARVVIADGTVAVQVWAALEDQPAYSRLVNVAARHAGPEAVRLLGVYWSLGDLDQLERLFAQAGLSISSAGTYEETATFASIDEVVTTEVESTPLAERISADVYRKIREDARTALQPFLAPSGEARIPIKGHLILAQRA